jgi:glycosidase
VLIYGTYEDLLPENNDIWAYIRNDDSTKMLIINNFTNKNKPYIVPVNIITGTILISNYRQLNKIKPTIILRPFEVLIVGR